MRLLIESAAEERVAAPHSRVHLVANSLLCDSSSLAIISRSTNFWIFVPDIGQSVDEPHVPRDLVGSDLTAAELDQLCLFDWCGRA